MTNKYKKLDRDEIKVLFAAENSDIPILEFFEDDPPLTKQWFEKTFPKFCESIKQ